MNSAAPILTAAPAEAPQASCSSPAAPAPRPGAVAWDGLAAWVQTEADKIQAAIQPVVERWDNPLLARSELVEIGRANWKRIFGKTRSARQVHRLIQRVIERDGGRREWTRRELYVRENPPRQPGSRAELPRGVESLGDVLDVLTGFATPSAPTPNELSFLWLTAWRWYQNERENGTKPKSAKAQLLLFLQRHASCVPGRNALRVMVARAFKKLDHAQGAAAAALDGRRAKRGVKRKPEIPEADAVKLAAYATFATGGRLAQASRELVDLREQSGLTASTLDLLDTDGAKSYVNRRVAEQVQPLIRAAAPHMLGKKAVDDATPALRRDYSKLRSMQVVTADDFTWPVYFYVPDGKGWFTLTRGQCLLFIDCRSLKIITWTLIPERNYNALAVRTAMNTVCLEQGRPDVWYFECGLWKQSNLVQGKPPLHWRLANPSFTDAAYGWEKLGVRFKHATRARSKPAELVGGLLQDYMERCPGYCGRNERFDCPEQTKDAKLSVEAQREHPSKHFYSFDKWVEVLSGLIARYNDEDREGRILDGRSPNQAFEQYWPHDNPPVKFDPSCWHLCAHYVRECEVKAGGISFDFGKDRFTYYDEALSALRHRRVLAWFDPGHPEVLGVTDLDQKNPFFVQRSNPVDFLASLSPDSPEAEHYRAEVGKQQCFNKHARAVFRSVKAEFNRTYRQNIVARPTATLGQEMLTKRNAAIKRSIKDNAIRKEVIDLARQLHRPVETLGDLDSPETRDTLRRQLNRKREALRERGSLAEKLIEDV